MEIPENGEIKSNATEGNVQHSKNDRHKNVLDFRILTKGELEWITNIQDFMINTRTKSSIHNNSCKSAAVMLIIRRTCARVCTF